MNNDHYFNVETTGGKFEDYPENQRQAQDDDRLTMEGDVKTSLERVEGINKERGKLLSHKWIRFPTEEMKILYAQEEKALKDLRKSLNYFITLDRN